MLRQILLVASITTFVVVVLGAWVRLSDAGLGCPDWPGCYGQIVVPGHADDVQRANEAFPERELEHSKAWKEMIHRYLAGALGLVILSLAVVSWLKKDQASARPILGTIILGLVVFQAALGMWTVTLLLKPIIVLAHLVGGLTLLSLLWWYLLVQQPPTLGSNASVLNLPDWARPVALASITVLMVQILLGGWTSTNYSALACTGFPLCSGSLWPEMDFSSGFTPWLGLGINYEFGVLEHPGRVAVHMAHRLGALVTFCCLGGFGIMLLRSSVGQRIKRIALVMMSLLGLQVLLGIINVSYFLPLAIAVAHNGVAAALLLSLVTLIFYIRANRN